MRKFVLRWLGLGAGSMMAATAAAGATACSSDQAASQEAIQTGSVAQAYTVVSPIPGQGYYWEGSFASCTLNGNKTKVTPKLIVAYPDSRSTQYGFSGGLELPFVTPWISTTYAYTLNNISYGSGCTAPPSGTAPCLYYQYTPTYEAKVAALYTNTHQFLVAELAVDANDPKRQIVGQKQFFYNGSTDDTSYQALSSLTAQYASGSSPAGNQVEAHFWTCIYVMEAQSNGYLAYTGHRAAIAQSHDPINWPD